MFKVNCNSVPQPLKHMIVKSLNLHNRETRQRDHLVAIKPSIFTVEHSYLFEGPKLWNALPSKFKSYTYKQFTKNIKLHYLEQY